MKTSAKGNQTVSAWFLFTGAFKAYQTIEKGKIIMVKAKRGRAKKQLPCCEYLNSENRFTVKSGDKLKDGPWEAVVANVVMDGNKVWYTIDTLNGRIYCEPSSSLYGVRIIRKEEEV